jgi:hypothetical protein
MEGACIVDLLRPCGREKKERMEDLLGSCGESIFDSDGKPCQASILESLWLTWDIQHNDNSD